MSPIGLHHVGINNSNRSKIYTFWYHFRAGLLDRSKTKNKLPYQNVHHREDQSPDHPDSAIIQKNGEIHQLGLEIMHVQKAQRDIPPKKGKDTDQEINISVKLKRNSSYESVNNTEIKIYQHKNILPNFYITLNTSMKNISSLSEKSTSYHLEFIKEVDNRSRSYSRAKQVFMYQHEPGAYFVRECIRMVAKDKNLLIPSVPLNAAYRSSWDMMDKKKKNSFQILYGGLSFGVCEGISSPCTYFSLIEHPLDRILTVYSLCQSNVGGTYCHYNSLNVSSMTLEEFVKTQGSNLFQKLLYYSRHCKLVGEDEICLPDIKTSFVLTDVEKKLNLENIINNVEKWFGIVGLGDHLEESLQLFERVLGHNFTSCFKRASDSMKLLLRHVLPLQVQCKHATEGSDLINLCLNQSYSVLQKDNQSEGSLHDRDFMALKDSLLADEKIIQYLQPDLTIYNKLKEVFHKQIAPYQIIKKTESILADSIEYNTKYKEEKNRTR